MSKGKELNINNGPSKTRLAFEFILRTGRASSSEIAAAVPGLVPKNVQGLLAGHVSREQLSTETGISKSGRREKIFMPGPKHQATKAETPVATAVPAAQTHAMTSVLKTGTKFGPGAHGGPIRDTGPVRDKGRPITLACKPAPDSDPLPSLPKAVPAARPLKELVEAAQRQVETATPAAQEAAQMQADQREEMERDLRTATDKATPSPVKHGEHCACCRHSPDHDADSELGLAVTALQTLELLLVTSDIDMGPGIAELLEPITQRVASARRAYQVQLGIGGVHAG